MRLVRGPSSIVVEKSHNSQAYPAWLSQVTVIFRDEERGSRISAAVSRNLSRNPWDLEDLTETPVGMWEPTYDPNAWATKHELHLFVQNVGQGDAESLEELRPQMISVLEWKPKRAN